MSEEIVDAEVENAQQMVPAEQTRALAKPMHRPVLTKQAIATEIEQRKLLGEFIAASMVEGIDGDYGVIPGTTKRTLLKPGAEKLIQLFYCTPRYTITSKVENYETGLFSYHFKCQILNNDGHVVAEGVGFASTYESKYRWTNASRKCPKCGSEQVIKGKDEYGGGWLCWAKKGGCGAKFDDNDPAITGQSLEPVQNPDIVDKINTVYKIAKKRAVVDAAISLARCSDLFTQDMDDTIGGSPSKPDDMSPHANGMKPGAKNATQVRREEKAKAANEDVSRGEQMQQSGQQQQQPQGQYPENKICPKCGVKAVGRSKYPPRGNENGTKGWFCYKPAGGCGSGFAYEDPAFAAAPAEEEPVDKDLVKQWDDWAQGKGLSIETYNRIYAEEKDAIKALPKNTRIAVWGVIKGRAEERGWSFDKDSMSFVSN